jgi:hypothetical protein
MTAPIRLVAIAILLAGIAACGESQAPVTAETYALATVNGQLLPAVLDQSAVRKIEISSGSLALLSDRRAVASNSIRVTDTGEYPVDSVETVEGTFERLTDHVVVTFANGYVHTFETLSDGHRLRTVSLTCTGECVANTDVLRIFEFHRATVIGPIPD